MVGKPWTSAQQRRTAMVTKPCRGQKRYRDRIGFHNQVYRVLRPLKDEQGNLEGTVVVFMILPILQFRLDKIRVCRQRVSRAAP